MAEEIIEITVGPDGKAEMRVNGMPGMDCLAETGPCPGCFKPADSIAPTCSR
jgi:hypothetical protein